MMSIFSSVKDTINRYGSSVCIDNNGEKTNTKAFVEPLRYKNRIYVGGEYHRLGFRRTEKYLYIGTPDDKLIANTSVIELKDCKYIVKRCENYYVNDSCIYVWAILVPYGESLEDDYESD